MKLKHLESALQGVTLYSELGPGKTKIELEQYSTSPHLAARMVYNAHSYGDIEGRVVMDLGCGTGILGIAAGVMGAAAVTGVDVDRSALDVAAQNIEEMEVDMELLCCDLSREMQCLSTDGGAEEEKEGAEAGGDAATGAAEAVTRRQIISDGTVEDGEHGLEHQSQTSAACPAAAAQKEEEPSEGLAPGARTGEGEGEGEGAAQGAGEDRVGPGGAEGRHRRRRRRRRTEGSGRGARVVDTVLMNPPFGTRNAGMDTLFLWRAVQLAGGAVYTMHKSSTRDFILGKAKDWGCEAQVLAQMRFDIPATYKFHKKKSMDVEVDLIRLQIPQEQQREGDRLKEEEDD